MCTDNHYPLLKFVEACSLTKLLNEAVRCPSRHCNWGLTVLWLSQVQLLPIRLDIAENPPFEAVVRKASEASRAAAQHAGIALEQLLEAAGTEEPAKQGSAEFASAPHPLFQAALAVRMPGGADSSISDIALQSRFDHVPKRLERIVAPLVPSR